MPKKKTTEVNASTSDLALMGIQYDALKKQSKELDNKCKELRKPLESYLESAGKELSNGSRLVVLTHADLDVHLKHTLRTGKVLLPEAMDVLKANGLDECIEMVPTIREDVIEHLYEIGKVSDEVITKLYAEKSTYAFSVDIKKHFDVDGEES